MNKDQEIEKSIKRNPSVQSGMPVSTYKAIINGNAQFIIELAKQLKLRFTITSCACFLTLRFFSRNSLFIYDRFLICAASIILAHKVFDHQCKVRNLTAQFDALMATIQKKTSSLTHQKIDQIGKAICTAQSQLLRDTQFDLQVKLPFNLLYKLCMDLKQLSKQDRDSLYNSSKIVALDSYRTQVNLIYNPYQIAISSVMIICKYKKINFPIIQVLQMGKVEGYQANLKSIVNIISTLNQLLKINLPCDNSTVTP